MLATTGTVVNDPNGLHYYVSAPLRAALASAISTARAMEAAGEVTAAVKLLEDATKAVADARKLTTAGANAVPAPSGETAITGATRVNATTVEGTIRLPGDLEFATIQAGDDIANWFSGTWTPSAGSPTAPSNIVVKTDVAEGGKSLTFVVTAADWVGGGTLTGGTITIPAANIVARDTDLVITGVTVTVPAVTP